MHIYFIRHGETDLNRKHIHQYPDVPLSDRGRTQAFEVGERLRTVPIEKIITSDLDRARETAKIISAATDIEIEENPLFREVRRPSGLFGTHYLSPRTLFTGLWILAKLHDSAWHFSDEENLNEIQARVKKAADHLKGLSHEHEHIVVVSHAFIINLFIKYMCQYKKIRALDYLKTYFDAKSFDNGSITEIEFVDDGNEFTCDWRLTSYNDTSHLRKSL